MIEKGMPLVDFPTSQFSIMHPLSAFVTATVYSPARFADA
jgi:hypothetical protein